MIPTIGRWILRRVALEEFHRHEVYTKADRSDSLCNKANIIKLRWVGTKGGQRVPEGAVTACGEGVLDDRRPR